LAPGCRIDIVVVKVLTGAAVEVGHRLGPDIGAHLGAGRAGALVTMFEMQAAVLPGQAGLLGGVPEVTPRWTGTTSGRGVWLTVVRKRTIDWVQARRVSIDGWPCW
jgi:hypothetical protein